MDIRGYETGPVMAEAAYTSDFAIPDDIPMQHLVSMLEIERRTMDIRPGMRNKYTPLHFDPATGARQVGGRYLFDTWKDAADYGTFTSEELARSTRCLRWRSSSPPKPPARRLHSIAAFGPFRPEQVGK